MLIKVQSNDNLMKFADKIIKKTKLNLFQFYFTVWLKFSISRLKPITKTVGG